MRSIVLCLSATLAFAQGTTPKPAPSEYEVHGMAGTLDVGAEYMVHSYSSGEGMYLAERYLVVEVALYPVMKGDPVNVDLSLFFLRLNGKTMIPAQHASQAAASLRQSAWQRGSGTFGGGDIGMGGQGPIPGNPQDRRLPAPPRTSDPDSATGARGERRSPEEVLLQTALPEGPHKGAVSGFVYFPYTGKSSSIKTVEIDYDSLRLKLK